MPPESRDRPATAQTTDRRREFSRHPGASDEEATAAIRVVAEMRAGGACARGMLGVEELDLGRPRRFEA